MRSIILPIDPEDPRWKVKGPAFQQYHESLFLKPDNQGVRDSDDVQATIRIIKIWTSYLWWRKTRSWIGIYAASLPWLATAAIECRGPAQVIFIWILTVSGLACLIPAISFVSWREKEGSLANYAVPTWLIESTALEERRASDGEHLAELAKKLE